MIVKFLIFNLIYYIIQFLFLLFYISHFYGVLSVYDKSALAYLWGKDLSGDFLFIQKRWIRHITYLFSKQNEDIAELRKEKNRVRFLLILFFISTFLLFLIAGVSR